uniref:Uncharacterized protein n=1 Tax=Arundo donax TaxID=35708 RepID=A0A0A8YZW4_ARUDO
MQFRSNKGSILFLLVYMPQGLQRLTLVCSQSDCLLRQPFVLSTHNWTSKNLLVKSFNTSHHLYVWNLMQALEDVS